MNIEQANNIALSSILACIGMQPTKKSNRDLWYYSPFREEKTPSFHVNPAKNFWYDFGEGKGGRVIAFVRAYLKSHNEDHTVVDALRWLKNMQPVAQVECISKEEPAEYGPVLVIENVSFIKQAKLIHYLETRGISLSLAKLYLKEVNVQNIKTGKSFYALGLANENGGYEVRNKNFKGSVSPKYITFIRGAKLIPDEVHVFEGFMDFLSVLEYQKITKLEGDAIILNSVSNIFKAFPYIRDYPYKTLHTWLDNNLPGDKASLAFADFAVMQGKIIYRAMNKVYSPHEDVNAWHMKRLGL